MKIYYNPKLKKLARKLRNNMSPPEILLWNQLKGKRLGFDFHRQKPIDNYIVDFFCSKLKLIIEVDGEVHKDKGEADIVRQSKLEALGLKVLRFKAKDIIMNLIDVIESIINYIDEFEKNEETHPDSDKSKSPLFLEGRSYGFKYLTL